MSRLAIKIIFGSLAFAWITWTLFLLAFSSMGDCGDDRLCVLAREANTQMIFWRGACVGLVIALAYRFFRKDADVH